MIRKLIFIIIPLTVMLGISLAQEESAGLQEDYILERMETSVTRVEDINIQGDTLFPTLAFQGADLQAVMRFFSETGNVNIVLDPPVGGVLDLKLKNVTWRTAFQSVLNTFDLMVTREGNTYRIVRIDDYRQSILDQRNYEKRKRELIPMETKIVTLSYADANAMSSVLQTALTDRGKLVIDARTNSVVVNDIPEVFANVESLVVQLDSETPQIRVSVRILSVDKEFVDAIGVSWDMGAGTQAGASTPNVQPGDQYVGVGVNANDVAIADQLGTFKWGIISGDYDINATVAALTTDNRGKVVDSPEIVTLDNQEARILSGLKIPINTVDEAGNTKTEFYDVGVELIVTPHITSAGRVAMALDIARNSATPATAGYTISTREAETNVIVDDGGAAVIGGLTTEDTRTIMRGVPVLKDIPVIGRLFRYEEEQNTENEIVIIVRPSVVVNDFSQDGF